MDKKCPEILDSYQREKIIVTDRQTDRQTDRGVCYYTNI